MAEHVDVTAVLDDAIRTGRIGDSERARYARLFEHSPELARDLVEALPKTIWGPEDFGEEPLTAGEVARADVALRHGIPAGEVI